MMRFVKPVPAPDVPVKTMLAPMSRSLALVVVTDALLPVFDRNEVAIVFDGEEFIGLITRVDLINHLRRTR